MVVWINDKKVNVPVSWEQVNTGLYQRIKSIEEPTILKIFGCVVGMDFQDVAQSTREDLEDAMYTVASFVFSEEYFREFSIPKTIKIDGINIDIPTNLEALTIEQNLLMRQKITNSKFLEECISYACAVYLQPKIDGGLFNSDRLPEIEQAIQRLPIEETFPVGFFLLRRLKRSGKSGLLRYNLLRTWWMNLVRRSQKWLKLKGLKS